MTFEEIRNIFIEKTGLDPLDRSRKIPYPDLRRVFYRVCFKFKKPRPSLMDLERYTKWDHSTILKFTNDCICFNDDLREPVRKIWLHFFANKEIAELLKQKEEIDIKLNNYFNNDI